MCVLKRCAFELAEETLHLDLGLIDWCICMHFSVSRFHMIGMLLVLPLRKGTILSTHGGYYSIGLLSTHEFFVKGAKPGLSDLRKAVGHQVEYKAEGVELRIK